MLGIVFQLRDESRQALRLTRDYMYDAARRMRQHDGHYPWRETPQCELFRASCG